MMNLDENIFYECVGDLIKYDTPYKIKGPIYILRDGKGIDITDFYNNVAKEDPDFVSAYKEDFPYHLVIQDYIKTIFGYEYNGYDFISEILGGIRCNDGSLYDELYVNLPTHTPNNTQYDELESWIWECYNEKYFDINIGNFSDNHYYSFSEYGADDIIKKIKRYYSSGIFYEKYTLDESLFEDVNSYYRYILIKGNKEYSLFIELGKYLKKLYNEDNEIYDDFNRALGLVEMKMVVPDLDYDSKHYSFAFTKKGLDLLKHEIEDLAWYIDEYSPYTLKLKIIDVNDKDIIYKDDIQIAWEI